MCARIDYADNSSSTRGIAYCARLYKEFEDIGDRLSNPMHRAIAIANQGKIHEKMGEYQLAIEKTCKAYEPASKHGFEPFANKFKADLDRIKMRADSARSV